MVTQQYEGIPGQFIHPVCNKHVIAGIIRIDQIDEFFTKIVGFFYVVDN